MIDPFTTAAERLDFAEEQIRMVRLDILNDEDLHSSIKEIQRRAQYIGTAISWLEAWCGDQILHGRE